MDECTSWGIIDQQRNALSDLLDTLTPEEWSTPSLCDYWTVRDVAAHLSMAATTSMREALAYLVRARGNFDRMIRDATLDRAAARSDALIVADLRGIVGSRRLAPGTFWRDPLLDILVHGQDIVRPLHRSVDSSVEASQVAAEWVWQRRFPFFPARRLRGLRLVADDADWARGSGALLHGPILSLLLVSTGRRAGLSELRGPGLDAARKRLAAAYPEVRPSAARRGARPGGRRD
jgi:uncharacterized protein (TIGR03083 family)